MLFRLYFLLKKLLASISPTDMRILQLKEDQEKSTYKSIFQVVDHLSTILLNKKASDQPSKG